MSTVPKMNPPPRTCNGGHVYSVSRETPPHRPSTWGPIPKVSRVTAPPIPYTWGHVSTVSRVTSFRPWTWGHISIVPRVTPLHRHCTWGHTSKVCTVIILPDSEIRFTCPQFPGLHPFPDLVPGSHIHSLQLDALSQTLCLVHISAV